MPGMNAAFVDIGLGKAAFLHGSDVAMVVEELPEGGQTMCRESIARLLREGQHLLVQVVKDQVDTKGAKLTTHIAIPLRYLVLSPSGTGQDILQDREHLRAPATPSDRRSVAI
jgi:ribonuclease G